MSEKEIRLIEMIRNNENPTRAFVMAMEIILVYLKHLEPSELVHPVDLLERV